MMQWKNIIAQETEQEVESLKLKIFAQYATLRRTCSYFRSREADHSEIKLRKNKKLVIAFFVYIYFCYLLFVLLFVIVNDTSGEILFS